MQLLLLKRLSTIQVIIVTIIGLKTSFTTGIGVHAESLKLLDEQSLVIKNQENSAANLLSNDNVNREETKRNFLAKCCKQGQSLSKDGVCTDSGSNTKNTAWYPALFYDQDTDTFGSTNISAWDAIMSFTPMCPDPLEVITDLTKFMLIKTGGLILTSGKLHEMQAKDFCIDQKNDNTGLILKACFAMEKKVSIPRSLNKCCPLMTVVRVQDGNLRCVFPEKYSEPIVGGIQYNGGAPKCGNAAYIADMDLNGDEKTMEFKEDGTLVMASMTLPPSKYCVDYFQAEKQASHLKLQVLMCLPHGVVFTEERKANGCETLFGSYKISLYLFVFTFLWVNFL